MMNLTKIILVTVALVNGVASAASAKRAYAPPGTDNIAAGYGAGYLSTGQNQNVICFGTDAGLGTANNTNCIFIGAHAGTNVTGKTGHIDIGGVFKADGDNASVGEITISHGGHITTTGTISCTILRTTGLECVSIGDSRETLGLLGRDYKLTSLSCEGPQNETIGFLVFESGSLNVYTNGVRAGSLSFTPVSQ